MQGGLEAPPRSPRGVEVLRNSGVFLTFTHGEKACIWYVGMVWRWSWL